MLEAGKPRSSSRLMISYEQAIKNFFGNWIWRAVHAMMDHQDFDSSPLWIAQHLKVSVEDAAEALDGLVLLGLARRTEKGFEARQIQFLVPNEYMELGSRIEKHAILSQQIVNQMNLPQKLGFHFVCAASDHATFKKLHKEIGALFEKFRLESEKLTAKDGVYCASYEGVDVMQPDLESKS